MEENRPTTHKNNGGEQQKVDPETQQYAEGGSGKSKYRDEIAEQAKELGLDTDVFKWKHIEEVSDSEEAKVIMNALTGRPTELKTAKNLPIMKKYLEKAINSPVFNPNERPDIMNLASLESYDRMFEHCEKNKYKPKKEKKLGIVLGLPSSGKSSLMGEKFTNADQGYLLCDSDDIKACSAFSGWYDDGLGAGNLAPASSMVQMDILRRAMKEGYNIAIPMVGRFAGSTKNIIRLAGNMGYEINVIQKNENPRVCASRLVKRFVEEGRYVGVGYLKSCMDMCPSAYEKLKKEFDENGTIGGRKVNGYEVIG